MGFLVPRPPLRTRALPLVCFGLVVGCSSAPLEEGPSFVVWETPGFLTRAPRTLLILVVDDTPSSEARDLRSFLAHRITDYFPDNCCVVDPGTLVPVDLHTLLIPASRPSEALHAGIHPSLLLREADFAGHRDAYLAELADRIRGLEAPAPAPTRYIDAARYWLTLARGDRTAANSAEHLFAGSLLGTERVLLQVIVAANASDESADGPPMESALERFEGQTSNGTIFERWDSPLQIHWGLRVEEGRNPIVYAGEPLLEGTDEPVRRFFGGYVRAGGHPDAPLPFGTPPVRSWSQLCVDGPVVETSGEHACILTALVPLEESCERPGWTVPPPDETQSDLVPVGYAGAKEVFRRCRIQQLAGNALTSCQTDPLCENCEEGFCLASPETLVGAPWNLVPYCLRGLEAPLFVRLPRATSHGRGYLELACQTE